MRRKDIELPLDILDFSQQEIRINPIMEFASKAIQLKAKRLAEIHTIANLFSSKNSTMES